MSKKGYVPDTFSDVNDTFVFVNLDMDLYLPMLEALKFFWDKMTIGGVLLLHDYYHVELPGVAIAVNEFEGWLGKKVCKLPCGDGCSLVILKN